MKRDAAAAARVLRKLADELEEGDELEADYARILLEKAQQNAAGRPSPQSAMAADALTLSGNVISSPAGTPAAAVAASSEFGSDIYPQFQHPHTSTGLWLYPAAEDRQVLFAADRSLQDLIEDVI
jgi:cytochrome c-type biogenesis protein CcmH/NrfG